MNPGRRVVRDVGMDLRLTKGIEWVEVSALKMTTRQMADEGLSHADDHGVCMGLGFAVNSGIERIQS